MNPSYSKSVGKTLAEGFLVGFLATQALDWLSTWLYERESETEQIRENEARSGLAAYEVAVDQLSRKMGVPLQKKDLRVWGWRLHKLLGWSGGVQYVVLRRLNPKLGAGFGLVFGSIFFILVDEVLVPALRLTPGPRAFSWKVHARGALSHLIYGATAEATARAFEGLSRKRPTLELPRSRAA